jgi:transcriptional regulator with XRE-family HTH domain
MNKRWPQQGVFVEKIKNFCKTNGLLTSRGAIKMDVVADMFNLNEDTLRQFLHDSSRRRPHINTLTHISGVLGCSVMEFIDAPANAPLGLTPRQWAGLDERERALALSLLADIAADNLTIAEKEALHDIFQAAKGSLLKLKEQ